MSARWPRKCQAPEAEPATLGRRQHGTSPADRRGVHSGGVISDGTMTRTRRATGEALLVPPRKRRSQVRPITTTPGKGAEGERVAEGPAVARKGSNVPGAIGPRCSAMPPTTRKTFSGPCQASFFGRCRSCCRAIVARWYDSSYGTWRSHRTKMIFSHFAPKARRASRCSWPRARCWS